MAKNIDDWFIWVEANRDTPTRKWAEEVLPPAKQALYSDLLEITDSYVHVPSIRIIKKPEELEANEQFVKIYDKLIAISYDNSSLDYRLREYFNL